MSEQEIIAEDTSNTNAESEVDEQTELLEKKTAQELFDMGTLEFKENKNFDVAAERFSMAVEKKVKELNAEGSIHVDLREYYLSFADALLTKEEEKNDLFEFLKKKKKIEVPETEEDSTEKEEVTDEQLAFEMFEFARKCYELLVEQKKEMSKKDILNYTYVFIRLGDISLLNHFFEEALKEYQKCVELREKHKVGDENLIAPLISLSQSYMFCGKRKEAVDYFEKVKKILLDVRQKTTPLPDNTNEKIIRDTYDDVQIQINDLKRQIEEEGEEGTELGSQTIAKELVVMTKSEFDKAVLNKENSEVTKITISTVNGDEQGTKRRRINLSNYKN
ncbi:conserved Plasmodium protein, unknown function [Plasmodium knowlesi strain H]|uniref:Tetratricopeptide SHNi-TPR domain-containing protein n=3 Tax=Plasmodium knowlesi TaxID=5850 RepID=A0A1A7VUJ1_PLAKH|nr:tetratricopeptide repeat protein, putative [Plasmodium knowlesi strain H]OTN66607.1 Uncharacterized protein PKNOH_S08476800 [Plasmodium knowlesi]CAA9990093.1 tetratricopeptide repeat protein, putative [Plasmodium knowlesi strain H]SBO25764.1 conserved Plasmodium protein, unknown function [Plasmodium knowlesi strain H]SBO28565.1 conserved Plasmodium protein, unknown function [Plasmodium knowlesi strain H]VVS79567.1 tetratricopeptide repeat protein, putative [Plasmodium knowlesi strain H]